MWPFNKKKQTSEFYTWRKSIISQHNPCRESLELTGECKHTIDNTAKLQFMLHQCLKALKDNVNLPAHVQVMKYRFYNECGVAIQAGQNIASFDIPIYNNIVEKKLRYQDTFENVFADAVKHNYYIELADDTKKLTYGFLVVKGDGVVRYYIKMSDYISINKDEIIMQGFEPEKED